ncbi:MAG: hypothetical protein HYY41_02240 [Chloroflexi bacterium]|nr:hypothetical protein [Chloroflexota bacterium]
MKNKTAKSNALWTIIQIANPYFVILAIGLPITALVFAMNRRELLPINYVHIMSGALWTGIDLFMGLILGPTLGGVNPGERANVFKRLTPKMTFFMPVIAGVTVTAGINLAQRLGIFSLTNPKIVISLIIVTILTIQGFGILLPNEIRILKQLLSNAPDIEKIARLGMRNARLGGIQGILQLSIIFVMAVLRF